MIKCTYIDGIGSSQAIDTAGEIVELKGLDISSLVGAAFNFEHESKLPSQIVGKILEATKIYKKEDCTNDRHLFYWNKCQTPFLYVMGRLFDDKKPSAVEVAALFKDDAEHPGEADMVGFSVEGSKIEKVGVVITRSIARKVTITHIPANKTCIAEIMPDKPESKDDDLSSLFKGEMELFQFEPSYVEIMEKKEDLLKSNQRNPVAAGETNPGGGIGRGAAGKGMKAVGSSAGALGGATGGAVGSMKQGGGSFIGQRRDRKNPFFLSEDIKNDMDKKEKLKKDAGLGIGATPDMGGGSGGNAGGGAFIGSQLAMSEDWKDEGGSHSMSHPSGHKFKVRTDTAGSGHSLEHTDLKGGITTYRPFQSPKHAKDYAASLVGGSGMNKSMTAGSGMSAPSQLEGGAALARESLDGKAKRIMSPAQKINDKMHKKEKWFDKADEAYKTWDKREDFRGYMKKRMPHLAEGEVDAIGRVLALKKTMQAEGKLSKMYSSYFGKKNKE